MSAQVPQITKHTPDEDSEEIDAMELHPCDNTRRVFHGNDRGHRNFGPAGRGSFGRGG